MYEFFETFLFSKLVVKLMSDDEYAKLQIYLNDHPEAGSVVPRTGGVRKVRWGMASRGKRGGLRVVYYLRKADDEIWMLTVYEKSERETIPAHELKIMKEIIEDEKENRGKTQSI